MVEDIDWAADEFHVALGVAVGEEVEEDIGLAVNVHVLVDHNNELGEAHLTGTPDGMHDPAGLHGVLLPDFHKHAVVEGAGKRQVVIDDVGHDGFQQWQENALGGFAEVVVFHGGLADDGGGVDGILAVGDGGDVEGGVFVGEGVEAGVVAEGALQELFGGVDVAFDDDFRVGGDFEGDGFAGDELDAAAVEEASEEVLFDAGGEGRGGGIGQAGLAAQDDGEGHLFTALLIGAEMPGTVMMHVPVHGGEALAEDLDAIHPDISATFFRVASVNAGEGDVAAGAAGVGAGGELFSEVGVELSGGGVPVERPALNDRKAGEIGGVTFENNLLAKAGANDLRTDGGELHQLRQLLHLGDDAGRDFRLEQRLHFGG